MKVFSRVEMRGAQNRQITEDKYERAICIQVKS